MEQRYNLSRDTRDMLNRVSMVIALGIPLSLCIKLIFEKKNIGKTLQGFAYVLGAGVLVLYYFLLLKDFAMVSTTRYIGVSIFLYLAFLYLPWIANKENYEFYVIKVFSSFFLTVIYSVVLYIGLVAIIFTVDKLFEIHFHSEIYYYIFLIVTGIFGVSLFLAKIPQHNCRIQTENYPNGLKRLLIYIVIPLIIVYTAILYAYFSKIIITTNWPVGLVSHLVLWYSVISIGVIFLIYPLINDNKLVKHFIFWFPKVIIPIIIMMYISMGIRIKAYGITENRYFVLVLGLWVLAIMIYFSFAKRLKNIIIPISLSIIVLNSVFGPLSSYAVSKLSQNDRLEDILVRNNMIKDDQVVKAQSDIATKDKLEINMILKYFNREHSLDDVKYIPADFKLDDMDIVFGFPFTYENVTIRDKYFHYNSHERERMLKVKDYDYLVDMRKLLKKVTIEDSIQIFYNANEFTINIVDNKNMVYSKKLDEYARIIDKKYNGITKDIKPEGMTFTDENENVKVMYIFNYISGMRKKLSDEIEIKNMDFYVLVKFK